METRNRQAQARSSGSQSPSNASCWRARRSYLRLWAVHHLPERPVLLLSPGTGKPGPHGSLHFASFLISISLPKFAESQRLTPGNVHIGGENGTFGEGAVEG